MYDPRIVRGNTYRLQASATVRLLCSDILRVVLEAYSHEQTKVDPLELQMQQEKQRRALAKKRAEEKLRVRTPDAVQGRQNTEVQTELYLEELTDR